MKQKDFRMVQNQLDTIGIISCIVKSGKNTQRRYEVVVNGELLRKYKSRFSAKNRILKLYNQKAKEMQLSLHIDVHGRENNPLSEAFLEENRTAFAESCFKVLKALVFGNVLTTDNAKKVAGTRSLPRRVKDLKDTMGFSIQSEWVIENGRKKHKCWFMNESDKQRAAEVILSKLKK